MTRDEEIRSFCKDTKDLIKRSNIILNNITISPKKILDKKIVINTIYNIYIEGMNEEDYNKIVTNLHHIPSLNVFLKERFNITMNNAIAYGTSDEIKDEVKDYIPHDIKLSKTESRNSFKCYCSNEKESYDERHIILHEDVSSSINCLKSTFKSTHFILYKL